MGVRRLSPGSRDWSPRAQSVARGDNGSARSVDPAHDQPVAHFVERRRGRGRVVCQKGNHLCRPCRCSSIALVQWTSGSSRRSSRSQSRDSIVASTSQTAGTCSATTNGPRTSIHAAQHSQVAPQQKTPRRGAEGEFGVTTGRRPPTRRIGKRDPTPKAKSRPADSGYNRLKSVPDCGTSVAPEGAEAAEGRARAERAFRISPDLSVQIRSSGLIALTGQARSL